MTYSKKAGRNSSIELLRILAMLGVVFLHYQNSTIGGAIDIVDKKTINYEIILFIKTFALCAVNVFILITGYYSYDKKRISYYKIRELLLQTILINEAIYLLNAILHRSFDIKEVFINLLPSNWFVVLYLTLYILSVYINKIYIGMEKKQNSIFLMSVFMLFSVLPTLVDVLQNATDHVFHGLSPVGIEGSQNGYTIVNFVMLYIIGSYLGKYKEHIHFKTSILATIFSFSSIIIFVWQHIDIRTATEYCNPILIVEAVCMLLLFSKKVFVSKTINNLAGAAFTVYLTHIVLLRRAHIGSFVNANILVFMAHIIVTLLIIYFIGWILWVVWTRIYNGLGTLADKMKID